MITHKISSCQDYKIQELTEVFEHYHDLPAGSYLRPMKGMVTEGHLTPEELLDILEVGVRGLMGTPDGQTKYTPGASHACDEVLGI